MNANQILNMILRMFVRKAVKTGVDASFKQVEKMRQPKQEAHVQEPVVTQSATSQDPGGPTREEVRQARRERQAIREKRRARRARKEQQQANGGA